MPFSRYVQSGRVAFVSNGPDKGKLVSIVDIIDQTRVLVDGPCTDVQRKGMRINQLQLTKLRVQFPFSATTKVVRKAWQDGKYLEKWADTKWAKRLEAKEKRASMTDMDRFRLQLARRQRNRARTQAFKALKAKASRNGVLFGKKSIPKKRKPTRTRKPVDKKAKKPAKPAEKK